MKTKTFYKLFYRSIKEFLEKDGLLLSASMAYYALITIIPFIILLIILSGIFFESAILTYLLNFIIEIGGQNVGNLILNILIEAESKKVTSFISLIFTVIGSTALFNQVQDIIENTWNINKEEAESKTEKAKYFLIKRFTSIVLIIIIGFVLISFSVFSAIINSLGYFSAFRFTKTTYFILANFVNYLAFFVLLFILLILVYKLLPKENIKFRELWFGTTFTSLFFIIGFVIVSIYLRYSSLLSSSNIMSTVLALLAFFYYLSVIFIFGIHFTYICAKYFRKKRILEKF